MSGSSRSCQWLDMDMSWKEKWWKMAGRMKRELAVKVVWKTIIPSRLLDKSPWGPCRIQIFGTFSTGKKGKIMEDHGRNNQFFPADFPINPYIDEFWVNITIPSAIKSRIFPATRPPCIVDFHGFSYYSSIFSHDLPIKTFIFPSFFHGTKSEVPSASAAKVQRCRGLAAKAMDDAERGSASSGSEDSESSASSTIYPTRPLDDDWWTLSGGWRGWGE